MMAKRVYLSHGRNDSELADAIRRALNVAGHSVDDATQAMGESQTLDKALRDAELFVLLVSDSSAHSPNLAFDVGVAQAEGARILPVYLTASARDAVPSSIRSLSGLSVEGLANDQISTRVLAAISEQGAKEASGHAVSMDLDTAAVGSKRWFDVARAIDESSPHHEALVSAFQYDLAEVGEVDRRQQWGPFAPWLETAEGQVLPRPLRSVPDEWLEVWAAYLEASATPVVVSRLADLLWESRHGNRPDRHAQRAIDAYVSIAHGEWHPVERASCIARALEIARAIDSEEGIATVTASMTSLASESLQDPESGPGVTLRYLEPLAALPPNMRPGELGALLSETDQKYRADPWIRSHVINIQLRIAPGSQRRRLQETVVSTWEKAAENADGLARVHHLQQAMAAARDHGLAGRADALIRRLESITGDDLDLQEVSSTVEMSRERYEANLRFFTDTEDWMEALTRFGAYGPPSGRFDENVAVVERQMSDFPLQFLFSKVVLDPSGFPLKTIQGEEAHRKLAIVEHETLGIGVWGTAASDILVRHRHKFGPRSRAQLREAFTTSILVPEAADRFARGLNLYWQRRYDESGLLSVTAAEVAIRELARQAGLSIHRPPVGEREGAVRPLGDLLRSLEPQLDHSWWRYLVNVLVDPLGLNLRNRIAHGLLPSVTRDQAAILLHVLSFLRLLAASDSQPQS